MSWNGSGTFTRTNGVFTGAGVWNSDKGAGVKVITSRHDTHDEDLANGINNCLTKDGQNSPTANLPMGGFRHTGVSNATARSQYSTLGQLEDLGAIWLGVATGTATALIGTPPSGVLPSFTTGQVFRIVAASDSTGLVPTVHTLDVPVIPGVKEIKLGDGVTNPTSGSWLAGSVLNLLYDGINFRLLNDAGGWKSYTLTSIGGGTMSVTVTTNRFTRFRKDNDTCFLELSLVFTTGGTASAFINIPLPVNAVTGGAVDAIPCIVSEGGVPVVSYARVENATTIRVLRNMDTSINWGLGANRTLIVKIAYRCV